MSGLLNRFLRSFRRRRIEPEPEQQRNPLPTAPLLSAIEIAEPIIETKYANIELFTRKPKTSNRITNVSISRRSQTIPLAIYRNNNRTTHAYILDVLKIFNSHGDNKSKKNTYLNDIRIIAELFKSPSSFDEIRRTRPSFSMAMSIDEIEKSIKIITKNIENNESLKYLTYEEIAIIIFYIKNFIQEYFPQDLEKENNYSCLTFFYILFTSFGINNEIMFKLIQQMKKIISSQKTFSYDIFYLYCELILLFTPLNYMYAYKNSSIVEETSHSITTEINFIEDIDFFLNKISLLNLSVYHENYFFMEETLTALTGISKKRGVIITGGKNKKKKRLLKKK